MLMVPPSTNRDTQKSLPQSMDRGRFKAEETLWTTEQSSTASTRWLLSARLSSLSGRTPPRRVIGTLTYLSALEPPLIRNRRALEISLMIKQTFEAVVLTELAPRSQIDIFVSVLQADGGTRSAAINAVTLALIDAGVPMREFVCSCAAGFVNGTAILGSSSPLHLPYHSPQTHPDLNYLEDSSGPDIPVAFLPQSGKVTMLQMNSKLRMEEFEQVMTLAVSGCVKLHSLLLEAVKERTEALIESRGVFRS